MNRSSVYGDLVMGMLSMDDFYIQTGYKYVNVRGYYREKPKKRKRKRKSIKSAYDELDEIY